MKLLQQLANEIVTQFLNFHLGRGDSPGADSDRPPMKCLYQRRNMRRENRELKLSEFVMKLVMKVGLVQCFVSLRLG